MPLSSIAGAASRRDRPSGIVTLERLDDAHLRALHQRVDRRAVGHVAAQHVVAGAQLAAAQRERGVELEEAGVVDHALALEQLADACRRRRPRGSGRRPRRPARRSSPWNGWNVALMTYSARADEQPARAARRGAGTSAAAWASCGGSVGRPGRPMRWARAARLIGGALGDRRCGAAGGSGSNACSASGSGSGSGSASGAAARRPRRARARRAGPRAPRRPAGAPLVSGRPLTGSARAPRLAAGGGTAGRPRPSRR